MTIGPLGIQPSPKLKFFIPGTTNVAAGAQLFTYAAGTTTKQATYSNDNQTPNTNPIILDANGECVCFVDTTLSYAFTFAPSTDTDPPTAPYWTVDHVGFAEMLTGLAPIASPTFTGVPTAPTPTAGDSSTKIATTQFVTVAVASTLAGNPTTTTQAPGDNSTKIATTAYVGQEITRAPQYQVFANSGTFTGPTGVTRLKYRVWGAGGGGGGNTGSAASGGGGGGGGAYSEGIATITPATNYVITIGTGGTAGTGSSAGGTGTATTIGTLGITAGGGLGGSAGVNTLATGGGGGGTASGGALNISGAPGWNGYFTGGNGITGPGGGAFATSASEFGGNFPGGGGVGGANGVTGGNGANGLVILEWLQP